MKLTYNLIELVGRVNEINVYKCATVARAQQALSNCYIICI